MKLLLRFTTILSALLLNTLVHAQIVPPPYINYQAVLYDVNGPNPNAPYALQSFPAYVNISDQLGNTVYREEHFASTDQNGVVTLKMGDGLYLSGSATVFNDIPWETGKYYLIVEYDINGTISATAPEQLVSVPYSFYSGQAGNGITTVTDNGNGTLTFNFLDGSSYTTAPLTGIQGPAGATGPVGPQGPQGPAGNDGAQGIQGPAGSNGTNGVDGASAYEIWIAQGNTGTETDFLNALEGAQGPAGATGHQGPAGNDGATGPQGPQGIQGIQGPAGNNGTNGADGASAYEIWIAQGNTGTETDFLNALEGAQGPAGATGPQGPQGNDGATGPQGPQGIQGQAGATGAQGPQGPAGRSAYESALLNGFVGTEAEWLASLEGPQGPQGIQGIQGPAGNNGTNGADGASAYEIWLALGNTGTQTDFLNAIEGAQGPAGATGPQGPAGNDGAAGPQGPQGMQGIQGPAGLAGNDGQDGVGIVSTTSNNDGTVTFTYSDGTSSTLSVGTGASGIVGNGYTSNISLSEFMNQARGSLRRVKVDNEGRINILGYFSGSLSIFDTTFVSTGQGSQHGVFLIQLSQQNTLNWAKYIGNTPNSGTVGLGDLGIDTMNNLYAGFASTLVKIDENGNLIWSKSFTNVIGVEVDPNQNILCLFGNLNYTLEKLSNVGNTLWNVGVGSTTLSSANADLSLAPNGDAFVMYNTSAPSCLSGNTRVVVTKINSTNGSTLWTRTSTQNISATPCASPGLALAIGSDNNGNCYVFPVAGTQIQISGITGYCLLISSSGTVTNVPTSWSGSSAKNTDPVCIPNGNDVYYISFNQQYSINENYLRLIKQTDTGSYESIIGMGQINIGPQTYISGLDFDSSNNLYIVIWNNGSIPLNYSAQVSTSVTNITGNSGLQILKITP